MAGPGAISFAPPCTTFSIANTVRPVRSFSEPRGFSLRCPKTWVGNRLADMAIYLLKCCERAGVVGMIENPFSSKMRRLPAWAALEQDPRFSLIEVHSCAFGSPHKKAFAVLSVHVDLSAIARRCPGFHKHVPLEGSATTRSSAYWPALAQEWARCVARALAKRAQLEDALEPRKGWERPWVDALADHLPWQLERRWRWREPSHINLLEQRVVGAVAKRLLQQRQRGRFSLLVDSRVTLCSGAKGRSPSAALGRLWRRTLPYMLGGQLYFGFLFVPSRKNPSDPPSRERPVLKPTGQVLHAWDALESGSRTRWDAWLRCGFSGRAVTAWAVLWLRLWERQGWPPLPVQTDGEAAVPGPPTPNRWVPRPELQPGRCHKLTDREVVLRQKRLHEFADFVAPSAVAELLEKPERLAQALEAFGVYLHGQLPRRSLRDYATTILAIVDLRRSLRRSLTQAWDYAALWKAEEPGDNRLALPAVVLRAMMVVCFHWNWMPFAALTAAGFAGIMRPSEFLLATRQLVVLPNDVQGAWFRSYFRIPLPKSRWTAARRQLARIDDWWVTELLSLLFEDYPPAERLWGLSPSAYRRRWDAVCEALHLETRQGSGVTPASLRAGGATALFEQVESIDMLSRRGRWQKGETAAIYVQEVAPTSSSRGSRARGARSCSRWPRTSSTSCTRPSRACARAVRDDGVAAARLRSARVRDGGNARVTAATVSNSGAAQAATAR